MQLIVQAKERQKRKPKSVVATCPQQKGKSSDQAKERQTSKLKRGSKTPVRDTCPEREGRARELAGAAFGVSGRKKKGCDTCHNLKGRSSDQAAANNKGNQPC